MAIIRKEKYLKDIAMRVGRGTMHFEDEDRPVVQMGGRQVYVAAVGYDFLLGEMAYSVANERGDILSSARGVRRLGELDIKTLASVGAKVGEYAAMRQERMRNLVNIESRMRQVSRKAAKGVSF